MIANNKIMLYITVGIVILISFIFYSFSLIISIEIGVVTYIFLSLISNLGIKIPMKELMCFLFLLQVFVSPLITYRYFNNNAQFTMYVDESTYMFFVIPATLFFLTGLLIPLSKKEYNYNEVFKNLSSTCNKKTEKIAFIFIAIGMAISLIRDIIPESLAFIFYLLKLLKFIGIFILLFSQNKFKYLWIIIVFVEFSYEIINGGVFYDLFVWGFYFYMLLEAKLKSSLIRRFIVVLSGLLMIFFVQSIKGDYRKEAWSNNSKTEKSEIFLNTVENKAISKESIKNTEDLDRFISRLNTGWILSKVLQHTPKNEPFTNGETLKNDLINVLLPRFLFPEKAKTGGKQNQKKFTQFTGRRLIGSTTMRIGALSDSYINFGIYGGWMTMFFLGLFFNLILSFIINLSFINPFYLLWIPFIFAYAIRMSDFQVILNYTIKSMIFVFIINSIFFKLNKPATNQ